MMMDMFSSAKRAFFQSAQTMHIFAIPEDKYFDFANKHFLAHEQQLSQEAFHFLYTNLYAHTWYIQLVLNRLYEYNIEHIGILEVQNVIQCLVTENEYTYQNYCRLFTSNQLDVLKAIAKEREVSEPSNQSFLVKYRLSAASSVRSALKNLVEKEFIYEEAGVYSVYDRFFGIWLAQNNN
jgi:DNA-binding MarR family transcriptional regulator